MPVHCIEEEHRFVAEHRKKQMCLMSAGIGQSTGRDKCVWLSASLKEATFSRDLL